MVGGFGPYPNRALTPVGCDLMNRITGEVCSGLGPFDKIKRSDVSLIESWRKIGVGETKRVDDDLDATPHPRR